MSRLRRHRRTSILRPCLEVLESRWLLTPVIEAVGIRTEDGHVVPLYEDNDYYSNLKSISLDATTGLNVTTLLVGGTGFVEGAHVVWKGVNGSSDENWPTDLVSSSVLLVHVPTHSDALGVGENKFVVDQRSADGALERSNTSTLSVDNAPPHADLLSISPDNANSTQDVTITITGTNFLPGVRVSLYLADNLQWPLPTPTLEDSHTLTISLPANWLAQHTSFAGIRNGSLIVINPNTISSTSSSIDGFTLPSPQPLITGLSQPLVAGSSSLSYQIEGSGFTWGSVVYFKKEGAAEFSPRDTFYDSAGQLTFNLTPADLSPQGLAGVLRVNNPLPARELGFSNEWPVTIGVATPVISQVSPPGVAAGSSDFLLTILGDNFLATSHLLFDGTDLSPVSVSPNSISFTIPSQLLSTEHNATLKIVTHTSGASVESAVVLYPVGGVGGLDDIAPDSVLIHKPGGLYLEVTSADFNLISEGGTDHYPVMLWDGQPLTSYYSGNSYLQAFVPETLLNEARIVSITVQNPLPGGGSEILGPLSFEVQNPQPVIDYQAYPPMVYGQDYVLTVRSLTELVTGAALDLNDVTYHGLITSGIDEFNRTYYELTVTIPARDLPLPPTGLTFTLRNPEPNAGVATGGLSVVAPPPVIDSTIPEFLPTNGTDLPLVITGSGFVPGVTIVTSYLSGGNLQELIKSYSVVSSDRIEAIVDGSRLYTNTETFNVVVSTLSGGTALKTIEIHNPEPELLGLSPSFAHGLGPMDDPYEMPDLYVTLSGNNFASNAQVLADDVPIFGLIAGPHEIYVNVESLLFNHLGTVTFTVNNPGPGGGTSQPVYFTVTYPLARFDHSADYVSPSAAAAGSNTEFTLTVRGFNFLPGAQILWDGAPLQTTVVDSMRLQAVITTALTRLAGTVPVTVLNGDGVPGTESFNFQILQQTPDLYEVDPPHVEPSPGPLTVTLRGLYFQPGIIASFAGQERPTHYISNREATVDLTAQDLATQGTFGISVHNPGTNSTGQLFIISYPAPVLSSVDPGTISAGIVGPDGQFEISVTGNYFVKPPVYVLAIPQDGSNVAYQLNTTVDSPTQLHAFVPGNLLINPGLIKLQVIEPNAFDGGQSNLIDWNITAAVNPTVQFAQAEQAGNEGTTANVVVTLSTPQATTVQVHLAAQGGTARSGSDYTLNVNTITFAPGETQKTVSVVLANDHVNDGEKTLVLALSSPQGAVLGQTTTSTLTIHDVDPPPRLIFSDVTAKEGNSGTRDLKIKLSLSASSTQPITIHYQTLDDTAKAGQDYTATQSSVTFQPGEKKKTITVPIRGDVLDEANEKFFLQFMVTVPNSVDLGDGQLVCTIIDNDKAPYVSIGNIQVTEGHDGLTLAILTLTLSAASGQQIAVAYSTVDGTATAPSDYMADSGTVLFEPETALTRTITIGVVGDTNHEDNETFFVQLGQLTNVSLFKKGNRGQALATIVNDD